MCVILISVDRKTRPSLETLLACQASNRDGGGVAWIERGETRYVKNVDANFIHNILKTKKGQVVAHFRIATVGGVEPVLCHPFPISRNPSEELSGKSTKLLFHNGTWPEWEKTLNKSVQSANAPLPSGKYSDSRAAAICASINGTEVLHKFGGKYCVLSKKGAFMYNEGWTKHTDGVWYSNLHWNWRLNTTPKSYGKFRKTYKEFDLDDDSYYGGSAPVFHKASSLFDQACELLGTSNKISDDDRFEAEYQASLLPKTRNLLGRGGLKTTKQVIGDLYEN